MKTLGTTLLVLITIGNLIGQNVGIGISNPQFRLHVDGNISANFLYANALWYKQPNQDNKLLGRTNAPVQEFWFGKDDAIYVSQFGNVGIDTTDPLAKLEVNGTVSSKKFMTNGKILTNLLNNKTLFNFSPTYNLYWMGNGAVSAKSGVKVTLHQTTNDTRHVIKDQLVIQGGLQIGSLGTKMSFIKKVTETDDIPSINADDHVFREYTVNGAMPGDIVLVSFSRNLPILVGVTGQYVSAPNTVRVKYYNENNISFNANPIEVHIGIMRFE